MGNLFSRVESMLFNFYEDYYPKNSWLHPVYLVSAGLLGLVGLQLSYKEPVPPSSRINFTFLLSLAGTFGSQLLSSFITEPALMRLLPRHQFGSVSIQLVPKYFFTTTLFTGISSYLFLQRYPFSTWRGDVNLFGSLVLGSFALNAINATLFSTLKFKHMSRMHQLEKAANIGITDLGFENLTQNEKLSQDPEYSEETAKFTLMGSLAVLANLASFISTGAQFHIIANRGFFRI